MNTIFFKIYPKVLICAPHADRKNYCLNKWLSQIKNLTYPNYHIFVADNSSTRDNVRMLKKQKINSRWVKPKNKTNIQYMAESHEACRKHAVAGGYDYILHWETDIENVPKNIIERLLLHKKKVVSACYPIDFGDKSKMLFQFAEERAKEMAVTVNADHGDMRFIDGTVKRVFASGLGCCLIKRSVFKKVKFRFEEDVFVHPDSLFALDLNKLGIHTYVDTSIILKHNNSPWINF